MNNTANSTQKMLNYWAISLIFWACFRAYFGTNLPIWLDELVAKPVIFLTPVAFYISKYEKEGFLKAVDLVTNKMKSSITFGMIVGGFFFLTGMTVQFIETGGLIFSEFGGFISFLMIIIISFGSSISEEILSRGFVLKRLFRDSGNMWSSVFFASLLFFFLHIPILFSNPDIHGPLLIQVMITDFLLSFTVSFMYLQKKNLMVPIIIHAFYNLSLYLFI